MAYAHADLPAELAQALQVLPCFAYVPDAVLDPDPLSRPVTDYLVLASAFAQGCQQHVTPRLSGNDLVVVTYSTHSELYGMAQWLLTLAPAARPRIACIFHLPDFDWQLSPERQLAAGFIAPWRHAAHALAAVLGHSRCFMGATNAPLARVLAKVFGRSVEVVPLVYPASAQAASNAHQAVTKRFDFALAGQYRPEKGSAFTLALLAELARQRPGLALTLQVNDMAQAHSVQQWAQSHWRSGLLDLVVGYCSAPDYTARLCASRLVLLPYCPDRYALRVSGVAWEAFCLGLPVVCPAGTWMADQVDSANAAGLVFAPWAAAAAAQAALHALGGLAPLQQQAAARAGHWQAQSTVASLLACVMRYLAADTPGPAAG